LLGIGQLVIEIPKEISAFLINLIWLLIIAIYFLIYFLIPLILNKKFPSILEKLYNNKFEIIIMIINWTIFCVPLLCGSFYLGYIYTSLEFLIGVYVIIVISLFFLSSIFFIKRNYGVFYPALVNLISLVIFSILGILNPFLLILGGLNSISFFITMKYRRIRPTKAEKIIIIVPFIIVGIISTSYILFEFGGNIRKEYIIGTEKIPEVFHIDWTWSDDYDNPKGINSSIIDALVYCKNLDHINISVTIAFPEEFMENDLGIFAYNEVKKLLENNISVNLMPLVPKEPNYFYINDFTVDRFYQTYEKLKIWLGTYNLWTNFTSIILDLEPLVSNVSDIFLTHYKIGFHNHAIKSLENLVDKMKSEMNPNGTRIIAATFGYFLDDFVDLDDSLYKFLGVVTYPPTNWEAVGFMCYERGMGAYYSLYTQCKAIDYYFGDLGIPYIISEQSYDNVLMMFKIMRNYGFKYAGIWALQDFIQRQDKIGNNATQKLRELHEELNTPTEVSFTRTSIESAFIHVGLILGDLLLWDLPNISLGSKMGNHIR